MSRHVKSRLSCSSSKSAQSGYSMHKGTASVQRKRKTSGQAVNEQTKKRRVARNSSEVQSGSGLRDGIVPRLTERQQLALAMEESKKAAAALQAKDRQASKLSDSEDGGSDVEGASDSEQDSVSEDESAVKPHRRSLKLGQPAHSLTSQHSDVASQLGQHDHQLCAKSGRLESLSGTSKQSHSSSSKLRLTADSLNHLAANSHLHHIDSDADSHPGRATSKSKPSDSDKCSPFAERQRTSDLSSRDVLDATEESRVKDEMQSEPVTNVRLPLEDGMDLLDKRTQRLALRKALSQTTLTQPQSNSRLGLGEASAELPRLQHIKSELPKDGFSASPKQSLKALKVRVKPEPKPDKIQQPNGLDSPAAAEFVQQQRRGKAGSQTPRDHHMLASDATPRSRNGFHQTPHAHQLASHPSAPMAQLVESDLFGDLSARKSLLELRSSLPSASPRLQATALHALHSQQTTPAAHEAQQAAATLESQPKTGLRVTLKHRLSVTDVAAKGANETTAVAAQPSTPVAKASPVTDVAAETSTPIQLPSEHPAVAGSKAVKRRYGKPGRPRTVNRVSSREQASLHSPAADASYQALADKSDLEGAGPSAVAVIPPETDAQVLKPAPSAGKGRGKARKGTKPLQSTLNSIGSRRLRSTQSMDEDAAAAFLSYDSRKQKVSTLLTAATLLNDQQEAWSACVQNPSTVSSILNGQPPETEGHDALLAEADSGRRAAALLLHAAAASAAADLKAQHELEGKLLTNSMMSASQSTCVRAAQRQRPAEAQCTPATSEADDVDPAASFGSALAGLWAPYQTNKEADHWYCSQRWTKEELALQDVRSPRRSSSHRAYDSGWDDLQARQTSEIDTLQALQNWYPK